MALDKYRYGIFYHIGHRGWTARQIKIYFDKQGYPYEEDMTKEQLVEELKKWEE